VSTPAAGAGPWRAAPYRFGATWRRRRTEYLTVVVLVGLLGGVALGTIAGARRTQSSYTTYLASTHPSDLEVFTAFANPALGTSVGYDPAIDAKVRHARFVVGEQAVVGFDGNLAFVRGVHPHYVGGEKPPAIEGALGGEYASVDRAHLVAGRFADPHNPHEAVMSARAAQEVGLHVGSVVQFGLNSDAQEAVIATPTGPSSLPPVKVARVTMVGIVTLPQDAVEDDYDSLGSGTVLLSPALTRQLAACCAYYSYGFLQLAGGSRHLAAVESELGRVGLTHVEGFHTDAPAIATADRAIRPVSVALGAFGVLAALTLLVVVTQVVSRQVRRHTGETAILRALGARPSLIVTDSATGIVVSGVAGAAVAVAVALALSPLFPLGPVRPVYPVGVAADWAVLGLGFVAIVLLVALVAVVIASRLQPRRLRARTGLPVRPPSAGVRWATGAGMPVSAVTGIRYATEPGSGGDPIPVRSAVLGATLAVVVVLGTVVFGASLNSLVTHPSEYGWNWDYTLLSGFEGDEDLPAHQSATLLAHDRYVTATAGVWFAVVKIDGTKMGVMGARPGAPVSPPVLSGHELAASNQIVLGEATMSALGKKVGDSVTVGGGGHAHRLTIVGTSTMPALVGSGMGQGAIIDYRLIPPSQRNTQQSAVAGPNAYLIRTHGPPAAALASLQRIAATINDPNSPSPGSAGGVVTALRPEEIVDSHAIVAIPAVLGVSLAAGAALALGATLVASVRRRRRDLAVLKTLGLSGRQLGAVIAWQSTVTVAIGTAIGVPLGIVLGHALWNAFAQAMHAVVVTSVPPLSVAAVAVGALVLANVVAAIPARRAARTRTATLLRAE
jgi:putative ABC transport system permease protein